MPVGDTTRAAQLPALDGLLHAWADTSTITTLVDDARAAAVPDAQNQARSGVPDEDWGQLFQARFRLDGTSLRVDDRPVTLAAGMFITAEIMTGKPKIMDYVLDPLTRTAKASLGEN
jgi:hemolysin D